VALDRAVLPLFVGCKLDAAVAVMFPYRVTYGAKSIKFNTSAVVDEE
jgi:hypothetical protein